jgi:hypothetical protein
LEELRKATWNLHQGSWSPGQDLNPACAEYGARVPATWPRCLLMNTELIREWQEAVVAWSKVISWNLSGETMKTAIKDQLGYRVCVPRCEFWSSRMRSRSANQSAGASGSMPHTLTGIDILLP